MPSSNFAKDSPPIKLEPIDSSGVTKVNFPFIQPRLLGLKLFRGREISSRISWKTLYRNLKVSVKIMKDIEILIRLKWCEVFRLKIMKFLQLMFLMAGPSLTKWANCVTIPQELWLCYELSDVCFCIFSGIPCMFFNSSKI